VLPDQPLLPCTDASPPHRRGVPKWAMALGMLFTAAAGIAAATWLARPRRLLAPTDLALEEEFVLAGGVQTHVSDCGHGEPAVVLLSGLRGWLPTWRHLVPSLARRHRVVLLDIKGFGLSTQPVVGEYSNVGLARHVLATLDALDLDRCIIGGISLGGELALRVALAWPERVAGLMLFGSLGYWRSDLGRLVRRWLPHLLHLPLTRLVLRTAWAARASLWWTFARPWRVTDALVRLYHLPMRACGSEEALLAMLAAPLGPSIATRIPEIRVPVLLVWGAVDRVVGGDAKRFLSDLPDAELRVIHDAGHVSVEEQPAGVTATVVEWLDRRFPRGEPARGAGESSVERNGP
jgi:pimeloyl-ACP methyl ester carboxylesterase